jgi:uncharacterized protein
MIEQAEYVLRDLGFYDVRVRHHELAGQKSFLARIEVGANEMQRLLDATVSQKAFDAIKKIGYAHVTVDLQGYRRGSLNQKVA